MDKNILVEIFSLCDLETCLQLTLTCKLFHELIPNPLQQWCREKKTNPFPKIQKVASNKYAFFIPFTKQRTIQVKLAIEKIECVHYGCEVAMDFYFSPLPVLRELTHIPPPCFYYFKQYIPNIHFRAMDKHFKVHSKGGLHQHARNEVILCGKLTNITTTSLYRIEGVRGEWSVGDTVTANLLFRGYKGKWVGKECILQLHTQLVWYWHRTK